MQGDDSRSIHPYQDQRTFKCFVSSNPEMNLSYEH